MLKPAVITRIELYKFDIPFTQPITVALGTFTHAPNILVRITSEDGLYGLGESSPIWSITGETQETAYEAGQSLAHLILGKDPLEISVRMQELESFLIHNSSIKCAFELALSDWVGKRLGIPLYSLLGGTRRTLITDVTLGIDTPTRMATEARRWLEKGFGSLKVKLGTTVEADKARMAAIREEIGQNVTLRIDANQGWDCPTAIAALRALSSYNVEYCEQPVPRWDLAGMKKVRKASPIPIAADESLFDHHDAFTLSSQEACDFFNIKLAKSGGIQNALKINALAQAAGMRCMIGCMFETRLGLTAAAHLASACPNIAFLDLDSSFYLSEDPVSGGITFDGEMVSLPDSAGLGADVNPEFLASLEHATIGETLPEILPS
jgi:L-Ala-D/L-Glu epimerase